MQELMTHVERIVRPVRARQSRKLKMRRELLAHLQPAYDDERQRAPGESTALERATQRLGNPADLTQQLQRSVPLVERLLLIKIPIPAKLEKTESRIARLWGGDNLSLMHNSIVLASGVFSAMTALGLCPWFLGRQIMRDFIATAPQHSSRNLSLLAGYLILLYTLSAISTRLVATTSLTNLRQLTKYAATMTAIQLLWMFLLTLAVLQRMPTLVEVSQSILAILTGFSSLYLIARIARSHRHPYDEWMSLNIAH